MSKSKTLDKKILSIFLATALMVSGLTIDTRTVMTVNAEESTSASLSVTAFVTPEQLVSSDNFALHGDYTGTAQKVYFGMNGSSQQTWYIAGSDAHNSIVLLCDPAKPMAKGVTFENDYENNKTYIAGWGNYEPSLDEGAEIYPNHYGASDLRVTLKTLETNTSVFSLSEQAMMQETTIHTNDAKNSCTYSTTDRLYAAYGDFDEPNDTYITVGANSKDSLNGGLKVNLKTGPYAYTNSDEDAFWLRAPHNNSDRALVAYPGHYVVSRAFEKTLAVVPAFRMNLSSVLFASAAPGVSSNASLTDTMTFRLDGKDKIASKAAYTTGGVAVNYDERDAKVFLYVQDADSVYSIEITGDTTVALSAMTEAGITSLTDGDTKIWLEKSEDNVAYALMAETASVTRVEAVSATCESGGNIEYWYYTVEGVTYFFSDGECANAVTENSLIIQADGHDYQFDSFKWADDGSDCKAVLVCDNDESHIDERDCVITRKIKTAPTCTEKGITTYTATYTDSERTKTDTKNVTDIPVVEHTWGEGKVTKEPTTTTEGEKTYICTVCGATKIEKITSLGLPEVGKKVTSEDGKAIYQVTESKESGGTVTYLAPTDKYVNSVSIPATVEINGVPYKVTKIDDNAFAGNTKLVTVKMGTGVKTIGKNAFYGCTKLKNVTIGKNVTTIGDKAFYKCTALTKITIPSKVSKIGKSAFQNCKKLKSITIKTKKLTTKKVGKNAFKGVGSRYYKKVVVKVPKKKFKAYKTMLIKRGLNKNAKLKKIK